MYKRSIVNFLIKDHKKLEEVLSKLNAEELKSIPIIGKWTIKDILAHISAWNFEEIKAIDNVLENRKPWYVDCNENEFNKVETEKRKSWKLKRVIKEWRESFTALLLKIKKLSPKEWNKKTRYFWSDKTILTVVSLFDYSYKGEGHEGDHAKEIKIAI